MLVPRDNSNRNSAHTQDLDESVRDEIVQHLTDDARAAAMQRSICDIVRSFGGTDPYRSWLKIQTLLGETPEERQPQFLTQVSGQPLVQRFLNSIKRRTDHGESIEPLLEGLLSDRRGHSVFKIPAEVFIPSVVTAFKVDTSEVKLHKALTVSEPDRFSWEERTKLGVALLVVDHQDRLNVKIRFTELTRPDDLREWKISIVSQDPDSRAQDKKPRYPGQSYTAKYSILNSSNVQGMLRLAADWEVDVLNVSPGFYHIYKALESFGATFDPTHPQYEQDQTRVAFFEEQLDALNLRSIRERSWAVHNGEVTDPINPNSHLDWVTPRMILEVPQI